MIILNGKRVGVIDRKHLLLIFLAIKSPFIQVFWFYAEGLNGWLSALSKPQVVCVL
jgi:hypothetical protein